MAFGKRGAEQARPSMVAQNPSRSARAWVAYPAAVLAVATAAWLGMVVMALIPAFNRSGTPVGTIAALAVIGGLNITVVSAVLMGLVDLVLSLFRYRRRWLYSAAVACLAYVFCLWAGSLGGGVPSLILYIGMVLIPAAIGGWILGHFRRG